jgi:hypothetical protein
MKDFYDIKMHGETKKITMGQFIIYLHDSRKPWFGNKGSLTLYSHWVRYPHEPCKINKNLKVNK